MSNIHPSIHKTIKKQENLNVVHKLLYYCDMLFFEII